MVCARPSSSFVISASRAGAEAHKLSCRPVRAHEIIIACTCKRENRRGFIKTKSVCHQVSTLAAVERRFYKAEMPCTIVPPARYCCNGKLKPYMLNYVESQCRAHRGGEAKGWLVAMQAPVNSFASRALERLAEASTFCRPGLVCIHWRASATRSLNHHHHAACAKCAAARVNSGARRRWLVTWPSAASIRLYVRSSASWQ